MVSSLRLSIFTDSKKSPFICPMKFIIDPNQYVTLSPSIMYKPINLTQYLIMIFYIPPYLRTLKKPLYLRLKLNMKKIN